MEKLLPTLIMIESYGAAIWYALRGDWPRAVYWVLGGSMTALVTFWRLK